MIAASSEAWIDAPPCDVFAYLNDPSQWGSWLQMHKGWPDGPPSALCNGLRFRQALGYLAFEDTVTMTVSDHRSPSVIALRGEGHYGADASLTIRVEPHLGGGSQVRIDAVVIGRLVPPLAGIAKRQLAKKLDQSTRQLAAQIPAPLVAQKDNL